MDTVGLCAYHWARKGTEIRKQVNNSRSPSWAGQALWHWETGKDHPCAIAVVCIRSARDTGDTGGGGPPRPLYPFLTQGCSLMVKEELTSLGLRGGSGWSQQHTDEDFGHMALATVALAWEEAWPMTHAKPILG